MIKRILFVVLAVALISTPALAGNRPEYDFVGDDSAAVFVDKVLAAIAVYSIDGYNQEINFFSDFTKKPGPSFNPSFTIAGPAAAEFFVQSAGMLFPDPCFSFISANDLDVSTHVPYLSALTTTYNQSIYRWRITLQMKPESDINVNIRDCVFKENQTNLWFYADQTGYYRAPWGQLIFVQSANPSIYVYAIPGPFATPGFTTPVILDARTLPGLNLVPLFNVLYTSKAVFEEGLVAALPFTGTTNASGQPVFDIHQGDMIDVTIAIPINNTVDIRYGADNVFLKYIGIVGTEYSAPAAG
jgi:hypothetical protein